MLFRGRTLRPILRLVLDQEAAKAIKGNQITGAGSGGNRGAAIDLYQVGCLRHCRSSEGLGGPGA